MEWCCCVWLLMFIFFVVWLINICLESEFNYVGKLWIFFKECYKVIFYFCFFKICKYVCYMLDYVWDVKIWYKNLKKVVNEVLVECVIVVFIIFGCFLWLVIE